MDQLSDTLTPRSLFGVACTILSAIFTIVSSSPLNAQVQAQAFDDYLIIPGARVGPITRNASENSLTKTFGSDNVYAEDVHIGEGFYCAGTRIWFGEDDHLTINWLDAKARSGVDRIRISGKKWATKEGGCCAFCL